MQDDILIRKLKITRIIPETAAASTFVLEPMDGWVPVYEAGQFLTLVFYTPYGEKRRSYSISAAPGLGEPLAITVKKVDNGEFSRWLVYHAQAGDVLYSSGISGFFTLPAAQADAGQYFFLAAGSGITPCFSLIKTLLHFTDRPVTLVYSNRNTADTIFLEQLTQLQQQFAGRFDIRFLHSDRFQVHYRRLSKWLLEQLLPQYLKVPAEKAMFYLCGPFDYMQTIRITLLGQSIPAAHIIRENFNTLPPVNVSRPPDTAAHAVTIHTRQHSHHLVVQYPQTILAAAKAKHIQLPYSCEAGRCGSCAATCTEGTIWMAYNEVLTDTETAKGRVLLCQAFPVNGDAVVVV